MYRSPDPVKNEVYKKISKKKYTKEFYLPVTNIFSGKTYNLDKEGVYRFVNPGKNNLQRIVFETNRDALISSIAWIYSHGNRDDGKNYSEICGLFRQMAVRSYKLTEYVLTNKLGYVPIPGYYDGNVDI